MAALKEPVKIFIVQSLACFETPQQVVMLSSKDLALRLIVDNVKSMIQQNLLDVI
jgi:hypothetical protein